MQMSIAQVESLAREEDVIVEVDGDRRALLVHSADGRTMVALPWDTSARRAEWAIRSAGLAREPGA